MYTLYAKMMNAWLRSLWVWYIIYTTSTKIMASAAASMMTEACSRRPWNLTVCCTGGLGGIGAYYHYLMVCSEMNNRCSVYKRPRKVKKLY